MNYNLIKCDKSEVNLLDLLQREDKGRLISFFSHKSSWAEGVLEAINTKTSILELLTPDTNVYIDCGSHAGFSCLFAEPFCKKIYAIEPTPNHFYFLESLTKNNPKISRFFGAIGKETGNFPFYQDVINNTQNSLVAHNNGSMMGFINTITIKDFLTNNNIDKVDLLKLDVEGGEIPLILDNSFDEVSGKIQKIYIEVHNIECGEYQNSCSTNVQLIKNKLEKLRFKVKVINDVILAKNESVT